MKFYLRLGKKHTLIIFFAFIFLLGCQRPFHRIISEVVGTMKDKSISGLFMNMHLPYKDGWEFYEPSEPGYARFGVTVEDYINVHKGVKVHRVTFIEKDEDYLFEIQTCGNIDAAMRKYTNGLQFHIKISDIGSQTPYHIFTTADLKEAVVVKAPQGDIVLTLNEKDELLGVHWDSPKDVITRLKLKVNNDLLRIYLPKKLVHKIIKNISPDKIIWWDVYVRLAVLPLKPIDSNIPGIYRMPVYSHAWPAGSITEGPDSWRIKRVSNKSK